MRQGRSRVLAAAAVGLALLALGVGQALAGKPPIRPAEGNWKGKTELDHPLHFRVKGEWVRDLQGGGVTIKDAHIRHGGIGAHENGTHIVGTWRDPRHVTGVLVPPTEATGGRFVVIDWHAHLNE